MQLKWITPLVLFACLSGAMHADTLNYTFMTTGVGSLDGVGFNFSSHGNVGVTFTMTANPANVVGQYSFSVSGPVTVSVLGGGTDTLTDLFTTNESSMGTFSLTDPTTGGGISLYTKYPCFTCPPHDDLGGVFGPVNQDFFNVQQSFQTAHGSLVLGSDNSFTTVGYALFQITKASAAPTPEPSSFVLLGSGALGLVTMLRKRRRA